MYARRGHVALDPGMYTYGYAPYGYYNGYDRWLRSGTFAGMGAADSPTSTPALDAIADAASQIAVTAAADVVAASADVVVETPSTAVVPATPETPAPPIVRHGMFDWGDMSTSIGTQIISIVGGLSGSFAGFYLGLKLRNATKISTKEVLLASMLGMIGSFVGIFLIRTYN